MKQEVRRGRKFIEYHDPDTQDEHTFTQEISGADVSYQDEAGCWRQLVEDWEVDGADGFSFRASRMNHKVRFDSIGAWRWYPRRNVETEYLVINRPQCWLTATKRWGNLLVNGISREGKDITLTSLRNVTRVIHSRWNGIKTDWILENANAPTRFRQKIDLVGITEIEGVLFGADGERLGQLMPTTATDANEVELPCSGSYVNGYVEFSADVTGAAYPVTIDPDFSTTSTAGDVNLASGGYANRNLGSSPGLAGLYGCFIMRFDCSSITAGNTATAATLEFTKTSAQSSAGNNYFTFYGITSANGDWVEGVTANPAKSGDPCWNAKQADGSGGVTAAWAGSAGLSTAGTDYVDTALTDTINVNRNAAQYSTHTATFNASGLTLIKSWFGTNDNNYGIKSICTSTSTVASSEYPTESYRPVLTVTYTAGGALLRVNMNAQMQSLTGGLHG